MHHVVELRKVGIPSSAGFLLVVAAMFVSLGAADEYSPTPYGQPFQPAQIVAIVGDQPILAGDLLPEIDQMLAPHKEQMSAREYDRQRTMLMKRLLTRAVESKLLYLEFLRKIPAENVPKIMEDLNAQFDKSELEAALEKAKVSNAAELDAHLRRFGSSLAVQRRSFAEQVLGHQMLRQNIDYDKEITHDEMLDYYRQHQADYAVEPKARWEQLMVRHSKFRTRAEAYQALADMGNEVLGGAPLSAVARRSSHGPNAGEGGRYDWTTKGSLRSTAADNALFTLPVGRLSRILEDEDSFRIIRVIERHEAGHVPFEEAQVKIKEKIRRKKISRQVKAYLERQREQTRIWTIFDEEQASKHAAAPSERLGPR